MTFGIGPAGTGKSYLAVALAVQALQAKSVDRIIMTRPAVEAGERLGFLPGDLMAKIDPYLRPLYDALYDMLGTDGARRLLDNGTIEVAPLAYMRGRTLNGSFIILDEAQNATPEQLKMFLTRIGFGSKVVVNGDITQVDLPGGRSGLAELDQVLKDIEGIAFVRLGSRDVVRHRIVADIVSAYDAYESAASAAGRGAEPARETRPGNPVAVEVFAADEQNDHPVEALRWARLAEAVLEEEGLSGDAELSVLFVDEMSIAELNSRFLGKDGPTDVLAFPIDEEPVESGRSPDSGGTGPGLPSEPEDAPVLLGDIVICPAVAFRNAAEHAGTFEDEIALLIVHGLLHLMGMDHDEDDEAEEMEAKERELLARHHGAVRPEAWPARAGAAEPARRPGVRPGRGGRRRLAAAEGEAGKDGAAGGE